jgi:hypothetical protein
MEEYKAALAVTDESMGLVRAEIYNEIGDMYRVKAWPGGAQWYEKCLAIQKPVLGEIHPEVAHTYQHLGEVQRHGYTWGTSAESSAAIENLEKSLEIWGRISEPDHGAIGDVYVSLGNVKAGRLCNCCHEREVAAEYWTARKEYALHYGTCHSNTVYTGCCAIQHTLRRPPYLAVLLILTTALVFVLVLLARNLI